MKMNFKSLCMCLGVALLACLPVAAQTTMYNFTDVNYPGDTFTQLLGINDSNIIAGYHGANINKGFTYDLATKTFTNENYPNSMQTQVTGINDPPAKTVGFYIDSSNHTNGFEEYAGVFTKVDFPGEPFNQLLGQNNFGQAVGYYSTTVSGSGPDHPYIYDEAGGIFEVLTIPGSVSAQATGINGSSDVCGFFIDKNNVSHGWLLVQGTFTQLDYPESSSTQALGVNENLIVVGSYTDTSNLTHGFTYNAKTKEWQSIDAPGGTGTTIVNGINAKGLLVGFFGNSPDNTGFVATPE
jgi:hypothetical protein